MEKQSTVRAPAFYTLALSSYLEPSNHNVTKRTLEHIRSLIVGGNEPFAAGGIFGWADGQTALALALSKRTPVIWDQLSRDEKDRVDVVMKALTVAAHWTLDYDSSTQAALGRALGVRCYARTITLLLTLRLTIFLVSTRLWWLRGSILVVRRQLMISLGTSVREIIWRLLRSMASLPSSIIGRYLKLKWIGLFEAIDTMQDTQVIRYKT